MAVTIRDVAAHIGVSPSTVSRVLNDNGSISEETKTRVYQAIHELDYHPNTLAQSFAKGKAGAIMLVMDARGATDFSNSFFYQSVFAIETVIQQYGYHLVIASDQLQDGRQSSIGGMVLGKRIDGIILPPVAVNREILEMLEQRKIPFVVLGQPLTKHNRYDWVDVNNAMGAAQAVEHLFAQGYRHIAYVTGNKNNVFEQKRIEGYRQALDKLELEYHDRWLIPYKDSIAAFSENIIHKLSQADAPDALICSNNVVAFHTLSAVLAFGKDVPREVGIVTFDNYPLAEYTTPPLTSVDIDTFKIGQRAAELLMRNIEQPGSEREMVLIPTRILPRKSTQKKR